MALQYKLSFPESFYQRIIGEPSFFNTSQLSQDGRIFATLNLREIDAYGRVLEVPAEDVATNNLPVSYSMKERRVDISYNITFVGDTASVIFSYLQATRFPGGTDANPTPVQGLEYHLNLEKYLAIEITDDCCVNADGSFKQIIKGIIPVDSLEFVDGVECEITGVIYEDSEKLNILKCLNTTVLGLRSNVGVVATAEDLNDGIFFNQFGVDTRTEFGFVQAKWFDNCVVNNEGSNSFLINLIAGIQSSILIPLSLLFVGLLPVILTINIIITAINVLPGVNINTIPFNPVTLANNLIDNIFNADEVIERIAGCKFVRGGFRVASLIKAACSICGLTTNKIRDFYTTVGPATTGDVRISYNPFVPYGDLRGNIHPNLKEPFNTAYIPAEDVLRKKRDSDLRANSSTLFSGINRLSLRDVALRATPIETTDKIFDRLSSLWDTQWNVVNTPNGYQLLLGPLEGIYSFDASTFYEPSENATITYTLPDSSSLTFITEFEKDNSDGFSSSAYQMYRGFINFADPFSTKNPTSKTYENKVQFGATMFSGSKKNDTFIDNIKADNILLSVFTGGSVAGLLINLLTDTTFNIDAGMLITSQNYISVPRLVNFEVTDTDSRMVVQKICRVKDFNELWTAPYRMADTVYSDVILPGGIPRFSENFFSQIIYSLPVGIQNKIPLYSIAYRNDRTLPNVSLIDTQNFFVFNELIEDFLSKHRGDINDSISALNAIINREGGLLGPFTNIVNNTTLIVDSKTYNFSPILNFNLEYTGASCEEIDLYLSTITYAKHKVLNPKLHEINPSYKLTLLKLKIGLGVVEEMEIDYIEKKITASGYVIPFNQAGINYFNL